MFIFTKPALVNVETIPNGFIFSFVAIIVLCFTGSGYQRMLGSTEKQITKITQIKDGSKVNAVEISDNVLAFHLLQSNLQHFP